MRYIQESAQRHTHDDRTSVAHALREELQRELGLVLGVVVLILVLLVATQCHRVDDENDQRQDELRDCRGHLQRRVIARSFVRILNARIQ